MDILWYLFLVIFGLIVLIKGAEFFVEGSAGIARLYKISSLLIGLTIVALGTSLPEFTVSLIGGINGGEELAISNIIGSNIVNIALILGICSLIRKVEIRDNSLIKYDLPFVILAGLSLLILCFDTFFQNFGVAENRLTLGDGLILLIFLTIFQYYLFRRFKSGEILQKGLEGNENRMGHEKKLTLIAMIIGGLIALIGGGKIVVDYSIKIAELLGASQAIIGLTLVAIGTSLPEAVTSIVAIRKKHEEIAIGNIVGSNIFNIFFVLGVLATIKPVKINPMLILDMGVMLAISILFFLLVLLRKRMDKLTGFILLGSNLAYFALLYYREII